MLHCQKHLFSIPDEVSYLNCSYMSPTAEPVELAGYQAVAKKTMPYEILPVDFFEPVAYLKRRFAQLVHVADPERIAVIPSVSYGIASAVKNVKIRPGQNIVTVDEIFPSNYYAWQRLAAENNAHLRIVQRPETTVNRGKTWNEKLLESIDRQTVAVALPHVHWADGTRFDLVAVRQRTREVGALLVIDGTQSVGAMPFDVEEIQPDALICAAYKWLLGPYSMALAYFGERFDDGTPIEENWINRLGSENFEGLVRYQEAYKPAANRYCMGENSQFIAVPMLTAALDLILGWGVENIQAYLRQLTQPYLGRLLALGCEVEDAGWRGSHLVGLRLPGHVKMEVLKKETLARQVFVSYRGSAMRISPHLYNDATDFERLLDAFDAAIK